MHCWISWWTVWSGAVLLCGPAASRLVCCLDSRCVRAVIGLTYQLSSHTSYHKSWSMIDRSAWSPDCAPTLLPLLPRKEIDDVWCWRGWRLIPRDNPHYRRKSVISWVIRDPPSSIPIHHFPQMQLKESYFFLSLCASLYNATHSGILGSFLGCTLHEVFIGLLRNALLRLLGLYCSNASRLRHI